MDLTEVINALYVERKRLNETIRALEKLLNKEPEERRGRKSMNSEERHRVSIRMRKYWAERRKAQAQSRKSSPG